jgi:hypothetical protein
LENQNTENWSSVPLDRVVEFSAIPAIPAIPAITAFTAFTAFDLAAP